MPNPTVAALASAWQQASQQVQGNARLRAALWLVLGLVWLYALLWTGDWTVARQRTAQDLREQTQRLKPLQQRELWAGRDQDAADALARLRGLSWRAAERGLIEANLQDWLRAVASKSGLSLRDLRVLSDLGLEAGSPTGAAPAGATAPTASASSPTLLRVRMVVEFNRAPAMGLLAELARNEPLVAVERMAIRTTIQPPVMELELRALALPAEGGG
jgi:hypothetical protein